jgi:hypothetical protein
MGAPVAAVSGGLNLFGALSSYQDAKSQASAIKKEGAYKAEQRFQEGRTLKAQQKIGFLTSGIKLEDDSTSGAVITDSWNTMQEDVSAIKSSAATQASNLIKQARANLLGSVASTAVSGYDIFSKIKGTAS